ncbi:hypothetical protein BJ875DRAFT_226545 [Amylocarpus encephaloides]|uniref:Uncharacterized protein n=1 Tax=Amylocarpus encephaloides TaxID=45428 RepID=A0A9P8BZZ6_9HELO|nr:hypothetical protein BJ875DRAFT_226545 [Amylocarpus encephaloides]
MSQLESDSTRSPYNLETSIGGPRRTSNFDPSKSRATDLGKRRQRALAGGSGGDPGRPRTAEEIIVGHRQTRAAQIARGERRTMAVGLGEAFRRTDANGGFFPRAPIATAHTTMNAPNDETGSDLMGTMSPSPSRLPISRNYSPRFRVARENEFTSSPPPRMPSHQAYAMANGGRSTPNLGDDESDATGSYLGSPSPAPYVRERPVHRREGSGSSISSMGTPTGEQSEPRRRFSTSEHIAKALAGPPRFVKKGRSSEAGGSIFSQRRRQLGERVAETAQKLARRTSTSSFDAGERETAGTLSKKTSASSLGRQAADPMASQTDEPRGKSYENEPLPPYNIPQSWGFRSKNQKGWIKNILSPENSQEINDPAGPRDDDPPPDIPLSTIEDVSSILEPTPPSSRPSSAQPNNASPEKTHVWAADLDFTAGSLQMATSPQFRVGPQKLEDLRDREMQNLTARALATNRLVEIRERNSEERVPSESSRANERYATPALESETKEGPETPYNDRTILEEEGYPIPHTPITVFPGGAYQSKPGALVSQNYNNHHVRERSFDAVRDLARLIGKSPNTSGSLEEEEEERGREGAIKGQDGEEETPRKPVERSSTAYRKSTVKEESEEKGDDRRGENSDIKNTDKVEDLSAGRKGRAGQHSSGRSAETYKGKSEEVATANPVVREPTSKRYSRSSTSPKSDIDPEERIDAEARLFDLQDNKSEMNSVRATSRSRSASDNDDAERTPRPKVDPLTLPTPKVTGAFIETPAPTLRKPREGRSSSLTSPLHREVKVSDIDDASDSRRTHSSSRTTSRDTGAESRTTLCTGSRRDQGRSTTREKPTVINSARPTTAAEDLRRLQREGNYEDSTLDDLDDLLAHASNIPIVNEDDADELMLDLEHDERGRPLSKKEKERRQEQITLARMDRSLRKTTHNLRDARHGIERIESEVSRVSSKPHPTSAAVVNESGETLYIKIPIPRLYYRTPPPTTAIPRFLPRSWKFTWLGFLLALFLAWYLTESLVCEIFCHPTISATNDWHPSDPFFPWAIPTKLDHWTGEVVSRTWKKVDRALGEAEYRRKRVVSGGSEDWWLGRGGPVGIVVDDEEGEWERDEVYYD